MDDAILIRELADIKKRLKRLKTPLYKSISFTTSVPFYGPFTDMGLVTISSNLVFSPDLLNSDPGGVTLVKIIANSAFNVTFNNITEITSSFGYDNTDGIINYLTFFYDGDKYLVNIFQRKDQVPIVIDDILPPVIQNAKVKFSAPTKVILTYNELLDSGNIPSISDFTLSGGKTISGLTVIGGTVTLTITVGYTASDVITVSYTSGVNPLKDTSGNIAANLVNYSVSNQVAGQIVAWENVIGATESAGFLSYNGNLPAGARGTVSINTTLPFEVYAEFNSSNAATILELDKDAPNDYIWVGSQDFEAGTYHNAGNLWWGEAFSLVNSLGAISLPIWVKLRKSGNDIVLSTCATENGSYSDVKTFVNRLVGFPVMYIHALFAVDNDGNTIQVKYKN